MHVRIKGSFDRLEGVKRSCGMDEEEVVVNVKARAEREGNG